MHYADFYNKEFVNVTILYYMYGNNNFFLHKVLKTFTDKHVN